MKKLLIVLFALISNLSFANDGLNSLTETILESVRTYSSIELSTNDAFEAQIRIRSGISGYLSALALFEKDKQAEKEFIFQLSEELTASHFAGLVKISKSGITSNSKPVDNFLRKVCKSFPKQKQKDLVKDEQLKCNKI